MGAGMKRDLTMSRRIARLLLDGRPRTAVEISIEFGLTHTQAIDALGLLRETHRVAAAPASYRLTVAGTKFAQHDPDKPRKPPKPHNQSNREYRARLRAAKGLPPKVEKAPEPEPVVSTVSIVEQALAKRPALQAAWTWSPLVEHEETA